MADPTAVEADSTGGRAADRLLFSAGRRAAARTAALGLASAADAAATLALPAALGRAVDLLLKGAPEAGRWTLVCALLCGALMLLDAADDVLTGTLDSRVTAGLRVRLLDHVLAIGPSGAARFGNGDLVTRGTGNAAHAGTGPGAAASALATLATPVGGLVALALLDPRLAAVFLAGTPLLALLLRVFSRSSSECVTRYQEAQSRIAGRLVEALGGARSLAAAGTWERERDRVLGPLAELSGHGYGMWRVQGKAAAQSAVLVPLLQLAVAATGGLLLAGGALSVGALLAAVRYAALAAGLGTLVGQLDALVRSRAAARRIAEVQAVPAPAYGELRLPTAEESGRPLGRLEFREVGASLGGRAVLRDLCLVVEGGSSVAVVGRSGAGKSLLAALAGRLAEPEAGQVLLDGVDLRDLSRTRLRNAVGYAFERPALPGGTVASAIALGCGDAGEWQDARVVSAARAACADGFVRTLPRGYDTPCAEAPLSGGEAQRLGLARAFAHRGRLLVLDDATSSLDTVTELKVTEALMGGGPGTDDPAAGRTRLIVAHRASTASRADLVAWLEDGRVRALEPHHVLWRLPAYRALFGAGDGVAGDGTAGYGAAGDGTADG
ncbi:ABC transporter ATP-binding protein [Streptomyces sp. ODS28]|uniref:ABC transporter ATP-binding protein n=1 Tax=Streptomyces sp. ODS28 TaxID=3136688 RepID=UPI0031EB570C